MIFLSKSRRLLWLTAISFFIVTRLQSAEVINSVCPVTPDEPIESSITSTYEGRTIGFCCKSCLRKFNRDPEAYLANLPSIETEGDSGTPIHEESHPDDGEGHHHATDHENHITGGKWKQLLSYLGKLHVIAVHLPVAFLPFAALFELIGWKRSMEPCLRYARINFIIGSVGSLIAAALGWLAAADASYPGELSQVLEWHRWMGTISALVALMGLFSLWLFHYADSQKGLLAYRVTVFALGFLIPLSAHFGGSLIYGPDYLF